MTMIIWLHLQELIPRHEPPLCLRSSSQRRLRIPSVDENHTKRQFGFSGLSPTLPPDSGMPSLRRWENLSLLRLFTGNSRLTCFKPVFAPSSISLCFSVFVFSVVYSQAKRLSQYASRAWLFCECLSTLQIDNHHHHHINYYTALQVAIGKPLQTKSRKQLKISSWLFWQTIVRANKNQFS